MYGQKESGLATNNLSFPFSPPAPAPADESLSPSSSSSSPPYLSCSLPLSVSPLTPDMHHQPDLILGRRSHRGVDHYRRMSYQNRSGQNGEDEEGEERGDHDNKKYNLLRRTEGANERTSEIPREKSEERRKKQQLS